MRNGLPSQDEEPSEEDDLRRRRQSGLTHEAPAVLGQMRLLSGRVQGAAGYGESLVSPAALPLAGEAKE